MKRFLNYLAIVTLAISVNSCQQEDLSLITPTPAAENAVLNFTLSNSSSVESSVATKTDATVLEETISNLDIFIFPRTVEGETAPDDTATSTTHLTAFTTDAESGDISALIPTSKEPCWVVVLANYAYTLSDNIKYSAIKTYTATRTFIYSTTGTTYATKLPMYCEEYFDVIEVDGEYSIPLERVYARIDVKSDVKDFVVSSVTLLNGASTGYYVAQSPLPKASSTMLYNTTTYTDGVIQPIYLFENNGGSTDEPNYTNIVIGGTYTTAGGNTVDSYLKVKLEYNIGTTTTPILSADIVRNTVYTVTLTGVDENNIGYSTLTEAKAGEYTDAEMDISIGSEAMSDVVVGNGDYYMSFSNSEYIAYAPSGSLSVTAFTMRYGLSSASSITHSTIVKSITVSSDSQGITVTTPSWTADTDIDVKVTLADDAKGTIIVRIGNLIKEIAVSRYQDATTFDLATAFTDDKYVHAKFDGDAPSWLKISEEGGEPIQQAELYSTNGFDLDVDLDMYDAQPVAELYLTHNSDKGRVRIYFEQYTLSGTPYLSTSYLFNSTSISYFGATITPYFAVTSTGKITTLGGTSSNLTWRAEYSYDSGKTWTTDCDWISMPTSGTGSLSASTITAAAQPLTIAGDLLTAQETLAAATSKGSDETPYDLSKEDGTGTQNTANCYIINSPGTYMLPLVYGNAIKNGTTNSAAYTYTADDAETVTNVLSTFVDYNGDDITTPYITNATSAIICWQDSEDLVTDVELSTAKDYLIFTVSADNIAEGNALVAIRDEDDVVMWSWHIWVTNHVLGEGDKNVYYSTSYTDSPDNYTTMMPVNLGWCSAGTKKYGDAERSVKVRIKQAGGATSSESGVTYTQSYVDTPLTIIGDNPYYQWGRKDPMLPALGVYDEQSDKPQSGDLQWLSKFSTKVALNVAIKNPNIKYGWSDKWCSTNYYNLWSVNNSSYGTGVIHISDHIKSVYDPSPVGYIVPPISAFSGFTTTGSTEYLTNGTVNVAGDFDYGFNFYCALNGESGDETIFFPAMGYRSGNIDLPNLVGRYAYFCSASRYSSTQNYELSFEYRLVYPAIYNNLQAAVSVRPVRETKAAATE